LARIRQGAAADRPRKRNGAAAGHGAPWITDPRGADEARGKRRNPMIAALWSTVTVEHDFTVESHVKNGGGGIRSETRIDQLG
jgi:hypothetical protein